MHHEAATLFGISFYSIIIKCLLKINCHNKKYNNQEMIEYITKFCKKVFELWTTEASWSKKHQSYKNHN